MLYQALTTIHGSAWSSNRRRSLPGEWWGKMSIPVAAGEWADAPAGKLEACGAVLPPARLRFSDGNGHVLGARPKMGDKK